MSDGAALPEIELLDEERVAAITAALDLREPNRRALESIAVEVAHHYGVVKSSEPFEGIVDAATGVGKTFILAGAIDYFAALGHSNFAVVTPGRTILRKTAANFTAGDAKSLLGGMDVKPLVVTSENFDSAKIATALEDSDQVKLFVFTVQSLIKPKTDAGRKTHEFQEGLGKAFYEHLTGLDDLIVFADEHHTYYGDAFSAAVRGLKPYAIIGLTATPHRDTPAEQIIFRYPLAAAIADKLVKTPVIVGRKDDREDWETKLQDGIRLLETKKVLADQYALTHAKEKVNPVMLVIAQNIEDAHEVEKIVKRSDFLEGRYAEHVLTVTSKEKDKEKALELLDGVEEPDSKVRVLISVGMLKEGWDVKNVYVICSLRSLISDILTEQTLGRGLRLPFGDYTGIPLLDTLEVIAHERYKRLLEKADAIREAFIDVETRATIRLDKEQPTVEIEEETVEAEVAVDGEESDGPTITDTDTRTAEADKEVENAAVELRLREGAPKILIPRLEMEVVESRFSLNDITELEPFKRLGERLADTPDDELVRDVLEAQVVSGADGLKETRFVARRADEADAIVSAAGVIPLDEARKKLVEMVMASPIAPARGEEKKAAHRIVDEFVRGLGVDAPSILSRFLGTAGARLVRLVVREHKKVTEKPTFKEVVEVSEFNPTRQGRAAVDEARKGKFAKQVGYTGWSKRAMFEQAWFDSKTERTAANLLDESSEITSWVRLHTGDIPILWSSGGASYNPDLLAIDKSGVHWLIEVKSNKELESEDVQAKRNAAQRWANHVSASEKVESEWRYLLASEDDIDRAKDWTALKALAST